MRFAIFLFAAMVLPALSACHSYSDRVDRKMEDQGQYWQRASVSSSVYMRGPKAQQMLNRDIATCVTELKELERLGGVKEAFPASFDRHGNPVDPGTPNEEIARWDTPERIGALYDEVYEYTDFETCMTTKGWERVEVLPRDVAENARRKYKDQLFRLKDPEPISPAYQGRTYRDYDYDPGMYNE